MSNLDIMISQLNKRNTEKRKMSKNIVFNDSSIDSGNSSSSEESQKSCVSFSTVDFHEHAMVLGDNPSTSCGPSLELDWTVQHCATFALDEYEAMRYQRRSKFQLIMPGSMRTSLLLESGYTLREIQEMTSKRTQKPTTGRKKFLDKLTNIFHHSG